MKLPTREEVLKKPFVQVKLPPYFKETMDSAKSGDESIGSTFDRHVRDKKLDELFNCDEYTKIIKRKKEKK